MGWSSLTVNLKSDIAPRNRHIFNSFGCLRKSSQVKLVMALSLQQKKKRAQSFIIFKPFQLNPSWNNAFEMDSNYHTFLKVHTRLLMAGVGGVRVRKRQVSSGCRRGEGGHPLPFLPGTATTEACPGSCSNWTKNWKILFRNFSELFSFPVSVSSASVAAHSLKRAKNQ